MLQLFWRGVSEVLFWLQSDSHREIQWELQVLITSGKKKIKITPSRACSQDSPTPITSSHQPNLLSSPLPNPITAGQMSLIV